EVSSELKASIADGLERKPGWKALEKVKAWLELEFNRLLVQNPEAPSACMTATWTITRLPSQVRVRPQADRSGTLRRQLAR
mgnify:CR=1